MGRIGIARALPRCSDAEDGGTFSHCGCESAGVVEVRMRVHDEAHGLARDDFLGCRHDRLATRIALAAFDHEDVVAHVDGERRVVAPDLVDALTNLIDRVGQPACRLAHLPRAPPPRPPPAGAVSSSARFCGLGVAEVMVASKLCRLAAVARFVRAPARRPCRCSPSTRTPRAGHRAPRVGRVSPRASRRLRR